MNTARIGPRYVPKGTTIAGADVEKAALLEPLATALGVVFTGLIEPHLKGGHRAPLEIDRELLDQFIVHMDSHGWMGGF